MMVSKMTSPQNEWSANPLLGENGYLVWARLVIVALCTAASPIAAAPSATVIYELPGGALGESPTGSLLQDSTGALYGTSSGLHVQGVHGKDFGSVFELTPPVAGSTTWTPNVLYAFQGKSDGYFPTGNVVMDKTGALYGTDGAGVFKLTPPAEGQTAWTETPIFASVLSRK
jgi:hypothetical protein